MKKQLTEAQFQAAISRLDVGQQTVDIARAVLVDGQAQSGFVLSLGLSKGAVSQAVNRVWLASQETPPVGFERVTAVLPEHQAFIVKKWAEDAKNRREPRK
ncbi:Regulatory protein KorA [Hydrogenophaga sp. T4]|nr:Regulatory protein KorA [Hydrogenophaga sp. T4]